jgi:hypothetical protein
LHESIERRVEQHDLRSTHNERRANRIHRAFRKTLGHGAESTAHDCAIESI